MKIVVILYSFLFVLFLLLYCYYFFFFLNIFNPWLVESMEPFYFNPMDMAGQLYVICEVNTKVKLMNLSSPSPPKIFSCPLVVLPSFLPSFLAIMVSGRILINHSSAFCHYGLVSIFQNFI